MTTAATMTSGLRGLPWLGGKTSYHTAAAGVWVASLLPPIETLQLYAEPFAGMLGVLLQRPRTAQEVVNDLDGRVVAFWRAVRDHADVLDARVRATPWAETEYSWAVEAQWDTSLCDVERARALVLVARESVAQLGAVLVAAGRAGRSRWKVAYTAQPIMVGAGHAARGCVDPRT